MRQILLDITDNPGSCFVPCVTNGGCHAACNHPRRRGRNLRAQALPHARGHNGLTGTHPTAGRGGIAPDPSSAVLPLSDTPAHKHTSREQIGFAKRKTINSKKFH